MACAMSAHACSVLLEKFMQLYHQSLHFHIRRVQRYLKATSIPLWCLTQTRKVISFVMVRVMVTIDLIVILFPSAEDKGLSLTIIITVAAGAGVVILIVLLTLIVIVFVRKGGNRPSKIVHLF